MYKPFNKVPTFRIYTAENKIKFAGTEQDSFFSTLEAATEAADYNAGDMIYEYCIQSQRRIWEVMVSK